MIKGFLSVWSVTVLVVFRECYFHVGFWFPLIDEDKLS